MMPHRPEQQEHDFELCETTTTEPLRFLSGKEEKKTSHTRLYMQKTQTIGDIQETGF